MDPVTAAKAIELGFAALDMAALFYDHARRKGATPEQLAAYRTKALTDLKVTGEDLRAAQGPEEGSGA